MEQELKFVSSENLPFGIKQLKKDAHSRYAIGAADPLLRKDKIGCCIEGCSQWLSKRRRAERAQFCPKHGISLPPKPTYVFQDRQRNFIVGRPLLERIAKEQVECWRLGNETSEDAVIWNVFVGLYALGGLAEAFEKLTGEKPVDCPELYLWGNKIGGDWSSWNALLRVRAALEDDLSIPTEPDVMFRVPGQAIALIEAKFVSANGTFHRKKSRFGKIDDFLRRYAARPGTTHPLNTDWIRKQPSEQILEQLCRNGVFAHWLAADGERPFVIYLVLGRSANDEAGFRRHLAGDSIRFARHTWEELCGLKIIETEAATLLRHYLRTKTLNLAKAFAL